MMRTIIAIGSVLLIFACSSSSPKRQAADSKDGQVGQDDGGDGAPDPQPVEPKEDVKGDPFPDEQGDVVIDAVPETGKNLPAFYLADGRSIGSRYRRIFPDFRPEIPEFFTGTEMVDLGTYVTEGRMQLWNNRKPTTITQEYIRTLRTTLNIACRQLVNTEFGLLDANAGAAQTNTLVTSDEVPTKESINRFMTKMFGYSKLSGMHKGVEEYHQLFSAQVAGYAGNDAGKKAFIADNYRFLCIAIGQDQRVFLK